MKSELQKQLFDKYPKIFKQKDLSMKETCMCWGIDTPDSWFDILDKLCYNIQRIADKKGLEQAEATQVKEKFGSLRFYTNFYDEDIESYIEKAEQRTMEICAVCSSKDNIKTTSGWVTYLCEKCREKKSK